ncbi:hypothetical protein Aperf_G00000027201 [Anoplocephala perfoliata]
MSALIWCFLCLFSSVACSDPYIAFKAHPSQPNCFQNEVTADTLTKVSYKLEALKDQSKNKKKGSNETPTIRVDVFDPANAMIMSRDYTASGHIYFTSEVHGVHKVCVSALSKTKSKKPTMKREARFRQTTNAISWKIFYAGLLQIFLLSSLSYWQIRSLKNYFIAKKLV